MKIIWKTYLIVMTLLASCGRTDPGIIKNNSDDTLQLLLKLNYPESKECPENFFREELLQKYIRPEFNKDSTNYWLTQFDTSQNIAIVTLLPNRNIYLGTTRVGLHRTNYKVWEFTELTVIGKNLKINLKDNAINTFVKLNKHFIGQDDYEFNIGQTK
jgi:hypothetical protein